MNFKALEANYTPMNYGDAPQPQKKKGGRGGFLSSLISEGGAAGGAALGTMLLPGVGTIIGAGLGAFGGRLAENQVRDSRWGVGDAAKEGALSAAFSSVAPLMKAGKAGATAARAGGSLDEVLMGARSGFTSLPGSGIAGKLEAGSDRLKKTVINPNVKANIFGASEEDAIAKVVDKYVKGGTAAGKYKNLGNAFNGISKDIEGQLGKIGNKTSTVDFTKKITTSLADDINFIPGDAAYEKELGRVLNKVASFGKNNELSASDLFKAKQYLNSQLKGAFNKAGADLTVPQQVRMAVWEQLDNSISDIAPKVKDLTRAQSMLIKSASGLQKASEKSVGVPILGLKSKALSGVMQKGQYATGDLLGGVSKVAKVGARANSAIMPQVIGRGLVGSGSYSTNNPTTMPTSESTMDTTSMPASNSNMGTSYNSNDPLSSALMGAQGSPYTRENLMADLQRDPKNADKYIAYFSELDKIFNTEAQKPKLNATQIQQANNSNSALQDLSYINQTLQEDPSVAMKNALPGGGLTRRITGTGNYEAARQNVADALGRLRSGGAINADEEKRFLGLLPGSFDDARTAQAKLNRLQQLFYSFANPQSSSGGLEDVLMGSNSSY